jgi:hypothetical protein
MLAVTLHIRINKSVAEMRKNNNNKKRVERGHIDTKWERENE